MTESQYTHLVDVHNEFPQMTIIVVPCNQFGKQEPWNATAVERFIKSRYKFGDRFYVTEKLDVNGPTECDLYRCLKTTKRWYGSGRIFWNFEKFLVSSTGNVLSRNECYDKSLRSVINNHYSK